MNFVKGVSALINQVVIVGRLCRDPELKYTQSNIANLRFTVAVNRHFKDADGNTKADFLNCVAWRSTAENMAKFLKKGSLIGVIGRIETGSYTNQEGQTVYTTDIVAESVQFLEPRGAQSESNQGYGNGDPFANAPFPANNTVPDFNSTIEIVEDDLPFDLGC